MFAALLLQGLLNQRLLQQKLLSWWRMDASALLLLLLFSLLLLLVLPSLLTVAEVVLLLMFAMQKCMQLQLLPSSSLKLSGEKQLDQHLLLLAGLFHGRLAALQLPPCLLEVVWISTLMLQAPLAQHPLAQLELSL
jgi:hypothetical protein